MKKRVYIETSVPSFYCEIRQEPEMIAKRNWTRHWWDNESHHYEMVTSIGVLEELERGNYLQKEKVIELISRVPLVSEADQIEEIIEAYVEHHVMPSDPKGDALHLAMASYHHCHFLLTWNCQHLANPNKFEHIRFVNSDLGLFTPILTTPFALSYFEGGYLHD